MLRIRDEQIRALEEVAELHFEEGLVEHIKEFAPKHAEVIGDGNVREAVKTGIERAKEYGFSKRGPIRFYVELKFMLGSEFDTDFQLPWANETLVNDEIEDELQRADLLHEKLVEYLEIVNGPKNEFALKALGKLSRAKLGNYTAAGRSIGTHIKMALKDVYPKKYEYLGEEGVETLITKAKESAKVFGVTSENGLSVLASLIFAVGHGFGDDPLFPWIKNTLNDKSVADSNERTDRLETKARIYFENALSYLEEEGN